MRKSVVLALALVLALAGSSFAGTITWDGEFEAKGVYNSNGYVVSDNAPFFGNFTLTRGLELGVDIEGDEGVWDASLAISADDTAGSLTASLGKYTVNVNEEAFKLTAWGAYPSGHIGHKGDALELLRMSGANGTLAPKFRLTSDVEGFGLAAQVESGKVLFNAESDFDGFTVGGMFEHTFRTNTPPADSNGYNRFSAYVGTEIDIVTVDGAFAMTTEEEDENMAYGVKVGVAITDAISVGASYIGDAGKYDVGNSVGADATYDEDLLKAVAEFDMDLDAETHEIAATVTYRGSADNVADNQLFANAHYWKNVAPAAQGKFTMRNADDVAAMTVEAKASAPVMPELFWVNAGFTMDTNEDGFDTSVFGAATTATSKMAVAVDGYAKLGDKLVFKPRFSTNMWKDVTGGVHAADSSNVTLELGVAYAVASDAEITAKFGQDSRKGFNAATDAMVNRYNEFGLTVNF